MRGWVAGFLAVVSGVVTLRNGAPAVNVTVVVGSRFGLTDLRGVYRVANVAAGRQVVRVVKENRTLVERVVFVDPKAAAVRADVVAP